MRSEEYESYQRTKEDVIEEVITVVVAAFCILNQDKKFKNTPTRTAAIKTINNGAKNEGKVSAEKYEQMAALAKKINWNKQKDLKMFLAFLATLSGNDSVNS